MKSTNRQEQARIRRLVIGYNQTINGFWSILNLAPIGYFCATGMDSSRLYTCLILSVLTVFLPNSFFDAIQLGKTTSIYHRIGIRTVKKYTQDGDLVNGWLRKRFPAYKLVNPGVPLKKHIGKGYMNEKFHFLVFVFFLFTTVYAVFRGRWGWVLLLTVNNLIFNVYPIFLQQYNRIRIRLLMKKTGIQ